MRTNVDKYKCDECDIQVEVECDGLASGPMPDGWFCLNIIYREDSKYIHSQKHLCGKHSNSLIHPSTNDSQYHTTNISGEA